ncbi:MAG: shikimate kinase AroK [Sulfuriflexus sp.]|nr:shikimate kinase AroK [Sulfuriflexus sp.]
MNQASNIFLVGSMGAGKTSVGKQLAKALKRDFIDSDTEIEDRTGVNIPTIFDIEGEAGFRARESQVIDDLTQQDKIVLATGGGAVLDPQNQKALQSRGIVFYLYASIDQLFQRTHRDRNRPLLQTDNPKQKITELLELRDPIYRSVADFVIETDGQTVRKVVDEIQRCLEQN